MLPALAKQLTMSSGTHGQSIDDPAKGPSPWSSRIIHTTVYEIPTGEEVLEGTFFLNECPTIILFDSGASYDFMSSTCAKKAKLSLMALGAAYVIITPEGRIDADRIV
jgi:hypothetical protein